MTTPCTDRLADLVDAAEGHATPALTAHLRGCEGCARALADLEAGVEMLRPDPAPEPGPWFAGRVRARAESARRRRRRLLAVLVPTTTTAAAAALVLHFAAPGEAPLGPPSPEVLSAMAQRVSRTDPVQAVPDVTEVDPDALLAAETSLLDLDSDVASSAVEAVFDTSPLDPDLEDTLAGMSDADLQALLKALPG